MDTSKSLEIIESMLQESRKSLHRNSFYFIMWGILMATAGFAESLFIQTSIVDLPWIVWPIAGILGGILSSIYSSKENKDKGVSSAMDRITNYTWGAFGFTLILSIVYSLYNDLVPHTLVLMVAGSATFISGGISKVKALIFGAIVLEIGALACAFVVPNDHQGYIFALSIVFGYVVPGFILRRSENGQA